MFHPQSTPLYSPFASHGPVAIVDRGVSPASSYPHAQLQTPVEYPQVPNHRVIDNGGPTVFRDPTFSPAGLLPTNFPVATTSTHFRMDNAPRAEDLEQQEVMARDYKPDLKGSLVGEKKSSMAIAEEYAKADPVYVAKTAHLPQIYSHYRPILGDGNCGWRAVAFSYFELLLRMNDPAKVEEERARLTSLNNLLLNAGGFAQWLCEEMSEPTLELLGHIASSLPDRVAGMAVILKYLNDSSISDTIVYHLRMLVVSWLRGSPDEYQGFVQSPSGLEGYCKEIQTVNQEIDHLGMTLLIDVLLKPIGIAVEIVYLDRSEGAEANTHLFEATDAQGVPTNPGAPKIYFLYRPSHYDILYKEAALFPIQHDFQVHRATSFTQQHPIHDIGAIHNFSNADLSVLLSIPGFSAPPPPPIDHGLPSIPSYQYSEFAPSPISTSLSPISPVTAPSLPNAFPHHHHHHHHHKSPLQVTAPLSNSSSSFRPSKYNWEPSIDRQESPSFQTVTFRNSHFNTAHYNNSNFQPEQWTPEQEDYSSTRKRSTC